jgi:hypothetical protein
MGIAAPRLGTSALTSRACPTPNSTTAPAVNRSSISAVVIALALLVAGEEWRYDDDRAERGRPKTGHALSKHDRRR